MVKNLPANAGHVRDVGLIPGLGRSPGEGHGNPLQYSCLENPMDRGAWRATAHRVAKSWTPLSNFTLFINCCLVSQKVKRLPAVQETWVRSLCWEDPLEKEMAIHSSSFSWEIPWTEKPGGLQSMGSQRVGHD